MDWDTVLDNLPINRKPDMISALDYARDRFYDRGDCDVYYKGILICNAIDVGSDTVKLCLLQEQRYVDVPADTALRVKWD